MNDMNRDALMLKIQRLAFAKTETELFLDTHPDCRQALDYYHRIIDELDAARTEYQNKFGPVVASESMGDRWTWIDGLWPWQMNYESADSRKGGK